MGRICRVGIEMDEKNRRHNLPEKKFKFAVLISRVDMDTQGWTVGDRLVFVKPSAGLLLRKIESRTKGRKKIINVNILGDDLNG